VKTVSCAAVDLGATSGRVIVGTWADNRLTLSEVYRFKNAFSSRDGHDFWDLPYLWGETRVGLTKAKKLFPRLASVGVDGWAVDHALVDELGKIVFPMHAYRDKRTAKWSARLGRRGIKEVYALTGIPNYPYNTSLQLQATIEASPDICNRAARCLFVPDYFNFLLSGKMENELSVASHSQLLDVHSANWSDGALAYFGVPPRWFSKPRLSPARLGPVTGMPELKGVLSVLVPGHDTACAFTAMPAEPDGSDLYLSVGTWSLLGFESRTPVLDRGALAARISNERMGNGLYRPLKSCPGLWLLEQILPDFGVRPKNRAQWSQLVTAASLARDSEVMIDVNDPGFLKPLSMRAAIDRQLKHLGARVPRNLASYVRLICKSLARGHADAARSLERLAGRSFKRILIVGGGSRNRQLCQATADATALPVESLSLEGSAVGNLASQLIALGAIGDLSAFRRHLAVSLKRTIFNPQPQP
jgi:rhamnulokinase